YNQNRPQGGDNRTGGYNQNRPQGGDNRTGGYNQNRPQNADTRQDKRSFTKDKPQDGRFVGKDHNRAGAASKENVVPTTEMRYTTTPLAKPVSRRVDNVNKKRAGFDNPKDKRQNEKGKSGKFDNNYNKYNRYNKNRKKQFKKQVSMPPVIPKKVVIGETIILQELAKSMSKTAAELIKKLFDMGTMATINQELDSDTAILLADEFGVAVEVRQDKAIEIMEDEEDDIKEMKERPPVVTVMGHVDHGKTSLLDAIRKTSVTSTEAGGITQHIGAYQVESNGKKITFLDTPGHEAFTSMRARGAQVTDISILVVAADDGVMPQTIEAINHSKAAGVSIIVAINKIDKPAANPDKVKQELTEHGLIAEEWGGETIMVPVSAKTGEGLKNLMDMILLVAEVGELKANSKRAARGTVVEAELDKGRGPVATLLIQKGTLRVGDNILAGTVFGKVRAMFDDKNRKVKSAGPSMPVVILGFSEVPPPGEIFMVVKDERDARYVANMQQNKKKEEANNKFTRVSLDDLFKQISEGEVKELNIIIKADVQGSVEAVRQSFDKLSTDEVKVNIIHAGVGAIKESDIMLATASNAIIIGFNVRPDAQTRKAAEIAGVDVRLYRVIYDAIEDIKKAMAGLLDPDFKEVVQGHAEVRQIIKVPKIGLIAGSYVIDGKITRQSEVRIVRDGIVVFEGKILSLRRFKDDAKEVLSGFECGIGIEDFNDIKEGDVLEAFIMEETKREL
ncbi:MAG: translation initiation factor IF-2, partial [Clostridia bacterium]|nr:translation initiation factor IF-2 [Clostridia bacterium]